MAEHSTISGVGGDLPPAPQSRPNRKFHKKSHKFHKKSHKALQSTTTKRILSPSRFYAGRTAALTAISDKAIHKR